MANTMRSLHIDQVPELAHLVGQVRASKRPLHIRDDQGDVAVLVPVAPPEPRRAPKSSEAIIARLHASYGSVTPRQRPEDFRALREEFEEGVADEVTKETTLSAPCQIDSSTPTS